MQKKGAEFAVGAVIMIVLGLIVLVILAVVVRQQVTKGASQYTQFGDQATQQSPDRCSSLIQGRYCTVSSCKPTERDVSSNAWGDCKQSEQKKCCGPQ